jgi:hypothetical protein
MTHHHDSLATVATASTAIEAQLIVNVLHDHGIRAVATGGFTAQFQAEAPGIVRVVVKQKDLAPARSVLAECQREHDPSERTENAEPSGYQPRLTRFGIWCLLILGLLTTAGILAAWGVGANITGEGVALLVASSILAAVILARLRSVRHGEQRKV